MTLDFKKSALRYSLNCVTIVAIAMAFFGGFGFYGLFFLLFPMLAVWIEYRAFSRRGVSWRAFLGQALGALVAMCIGALLLYLCTVGPLSLIVASIVYAATLVIFQIVGILKGTLATGRGWMSWAQVWRPILSFFFLGYATLEISAGPSDDQKFNFLTTAFRSAGVAAVMVGLCFIALYWAAPVVVLAALVGITAYFALTSAIYGVAAIGVNEFAARPVGVAGSILFIAALLLATVMSIGALIGNANVMTLGLAPYGSSIAMLFVASVVVVAAAVSGVTLLSRAREGYSRDMAMIELASGDSTSAAIQRPAGAPVSSVASNTPTAANFLLAAQMPAPPVPNIRRLQLTAVPIPLPGQPQPAGPDDKGAPPVSHSS